MGGLRRNVSCLACLHLERDVHSDPGNTPAGEEDQQFLVNLGIVPTDRLAWRQSDAPGPHAAGFGPDAIAQDLQIVCTRHARVCGTLNIAASLAQAGRYRAVYHLVQEETQYISQAASGSSSV